MKIRVKLYHTDKPIAIVFYTIKDSIETALLTVGELPPIAVDNVDIFDTSLIDFIDGLGDI